MKTGEAKSQRQPPRFPERYPPGAPLKLLVLFHQRLRLRVEPLPTGGEQRPLSATLEQPNAELGFQRLNLLAQRRLADAQQARRLPIVALFGQRHQGAQLFYIHSIRLSNREFN